MTIEAATLDRTLMIVEPSHDAVPHAVPVGSANAGALAAATPVNPDEVVAAVRQLQAAISKGPNPDFKLDYLSGLSVVTVRSNLTGEVVFQLPDMRALQLARLVKEGASIGSLGLFNTIA